MIRRNRLSQKYADMYTKELESLVPILDHHGWDKAPADAKGRFTYIVIASTGKAPDVKELREQWPTKEQRQKVTKTIKRGTGLSSGKRFFDRSGMPHTYEQIKEILKPAKKNVHHFKGIKHHR